jgi:hypothetical protein
MKRTISLFLVIAFISVQQYPLYAYSAIPQFLCEYATQLYQQGRYDEALYEFNKVLLIQEDYAPALQYIDLIERIKKGEALSPEKAKAAAVKKTQMPKPPLKAVSSPASLITTKEQKKKEALIKKELAQFEKTTGPSLPSAPKAAQITPKEVEKKELLGPTLLTLDEYLKGALRSLEVPQGRGVILSGRNIQRFLVTEPEVIAVEQRSADELLISGKGVGVSELHIWDDRGRSTLEILGVLPPPERETYEEVKLREIEKAGNFKLSYALDWSSFESGRRVETFNRISHSLSHSFGIRGDTPYGALDTYTTLRRFKTSSEFTYYTAGLTNGQIGPLKGFDVRVFDFYPGISTNLATANVSLRGIRFKTSMFDNKLDCIVYHGRESGGQNISPDIFRKNDLFLEGINLNFSPTKKQNYKLNVAHGWGRDRQANLNSLAYDLTSTWRLNDRWGFGYEIAHNTERFAHILKMTYDQANLVASATFRDIDKNFTNVRGNVGQQGEKGGLFDLSYSPTERLGIRGSLDVYRDTLNPALDNDTRLNEDFRWSANYQINPLTYATLSYNLQNQLGRITQFRYQNAGIGITHKFRLLRDINTYLNYYHQENKNFSSPLSDYINDKLTAGLRFSLIKDVYYFFNKEWNWFEQRSFGSRTMPRAYETGIEWYGRFGDTSPFSGNFRFSYRDEEDTISNIGFFSGEDYIENNMELTYRPAADKEIFGSSRFRNIWADNPKVRKRMEVTFIAGMRYYWDTGIKWESIGAIEGYVFNDVNQNGLKESNEEGLSGIRLWYGKAKSTETNSAGYYRFNRVKARQAAVSIDTKTIPAGYLLLSPVTQEVKLSHGQVVKVHFGATNRSEITGIVFEDVDDDGEFGPADKPIKDAVLVLGDGTKATTQATGRYSFSVEVGKHMVTLDLESLNVKYVPAVPIYKDFQVTEGLSFKHNIPLKKTGK